MEQNANDDINNFHQGFIFDGRITGRKHMYIHKDIYIDNMEMKQQTASADPM